MNNAHNLDKIITRLQEITHDLKTPLNGIIGGLDILKVDINEVNNNQATNSIFSSALELANLIDQLDTIVNESIKQEPVLTDFKNVISEKILVKKCLLVEDKKVNQMVAKLMLNKLNIDYEIAENGLEAIEKYDHSPESFDLILMDIQMPKMNGFSAFSTLKEKYGAKLCPVFAQSVNASEQDIQKHLKLGFTYHLSKPITLQDLEKVIQTPENY